MRLLSGGYADTICLYRFFFFQFACKAEKSQRAIDIAKSLHLSRSLDAAVKIATHHRMPALAERFNQIKEVKSASRCFICLDPLLMLICLPHRLNSCRLLMMT